MGDYDLDKHIGDVGPPNFQLPKRDSPERIPGPELHRLTKIYAKVCGGPRRRLSLPPKWVEFYCRFESTEWVTDELYGAAKAWAKEQKLTWAPGTMQAWFDDQYADWDKKQKAKSVAAGKADFWATVKLQEQVAEKARRKEEKALVEQFHLIPGYEQKQYRDDTIEILEGRFSRLPPDWVVEVNAAKLWKSKT